MSECCYWADVEATTLSAIYEDELVMNYHNNGQIKSIEKSITPSTGNDKDSQYVRIDLKFVFEIDAPHTDLHVEFVRSCGLSDERLDDLKQLILSKIKNEDSEGILFEIINIVVDNLTENNIPSSPCPICLIKFKVQDNFIKTSCFHHFHTYCIYKYAEAYQPPDESIDMLLLPSKIREKLIKQMTVEEGIPCPQCRKMIVVEVDNLVGIQNEPFDEDPLITDTEMLTIRHKMQQMAIKYEFQKQNGGIVTSKREQEKFDDKNLIILERPHLSTKKIFKDSGQTSKVNKRITKFNDSSKKKMKNLKEKNGSDLNKKLNYKHKNVQNPSKENNVFCDKRLNNRKKLKKSS